MGLNYFHEKQWLAGNQTGARAVGPVTYRHGYLAGEVAPRSIPEYSRVIFTLISTKHYAKLF